MDGGPSPPLADSVHLEGAWMGNDHDVHHRGKSRECPRPADLRGRFTEQSKSWPGLRSEDDTRAAQEHQERGGWGWGGGGPGESLRGQSPPRM